MCVAIAVVNIREGLIRMIQGLEDTVTSRLVQFGL